MDALKARPIPTSGDDNPDSFWRNLYSQFGQIQDVGSARTTTVAALGSTGSLFGRVVDLSVSELDLKSRECFQGLGVLAEGTVAPLDMLSHLWDQVICCLFACCGAVRYGTTRYGDRG